MAQAEDYLKLREEQGETTEFAEGFGIKAVLAALFAALVVLPGSMFMWLMLGQQLGTPAVWVTLIIFLEIAKRCRTKLTRQEMYIIWSVTFGVLGSAMGQGMNFIWMQYFVRSDAAAQFEITNQIPYWVAPPPGSQAYLTKNLLHRDWWTALELMGLLIIWWRLALLSLGYVMFRITSDLERLPFPLAPIAARGVTALAESEEETWRWRCFSVGSTIGIAFGLLYVAVPTLSGVFLRKPLYLLPVPFYDLTMKLQNVPWFRAVPLAISTNLGAVMTGFVLPFWMLVGSFVAGVMGRLVVNPFLYHYGVLKMWQPGMDYIETGLANQFDFWLSFAIGTAIAVAVLGLYTALSRALKSRKSRTSTEGGSFAPPKGRGDLPLSIAILFYGATTAWLVMLGHFLVPKFPIWILLAFGFGYTPLMSYVSSRLAGLTGYRLGIPYAKQAAFVMSGYKGVDIWFAPVPLADVSAGVTSFRQVELTGTKFGSYLKAQLFLLPLAVAAGLFFWSFLYKISEIPEDYPYAMRFWPRDATLQAFWMTATTTGNEFFMKAIKWKFIAAGASYGLVVYPIMRLLGAPTLFLYGTIQGLVADPAMAMPTFAGALLGRFYFRKLYGHERWTEFTPVLAAGFAAGMGLVGMGSVAVVLIAKAITMVPF